MRLIGFETHPREGYRLQSLLVHAGIEGASGAMTRTLLRRVRVFRGGRHCGGGPMGYAYPGEGAVHLDPSAFRLSDAALAQLLVSLSRRAFNLSSGPPSRAVGSAA